MTPKKFHLGWFMNFTPDDWNTPMASGGMPWDGQFYIEMARNLERARFDYIMIEDTLMVSEAYGGSMDAEGMKAYRDDVRARADWRGSPPSARR
jgi:long-chain alkane monooxygenase